MKEKEGKKKSLDVTGFTDRKFQCRGNSTESIVKTTFSPFFNESDILETKPVSIFNASCSIKCSITVLCTLPQYFRTAQM